MEQDRIYRGQIYYIHPQEVVGGEQEGGRPAVIVSNDVCNEHSRVVEVVFLTTKEKPPLPTHVKINSTNCSSTALCEQIESIEKSRIGRYINQVTDAEMLRLEKAMILSLQISTNLRGTKALEEWRKMLEESMQDEEAEKKKEEEQRRQEEMQEKKEEEITVPKTTDCSEVTQDMMRNTEIDIESNPAYIRVVAERDIYKDLYKELLETVRTVRG